MRDTAHVFASARRLGVVVVLSAVAASGCLPLLGEGYVEMKFTSSRPTVAAVAAFTELTLSGGFSAGSAWGDSVAVAPLWAVVGAPSVNFGTWTGVYQVFDESGSWVYSETFDAPLPGAAIGDAVAVDGNHFAIGAANTATSAGSFAGVVYMTRHVDGNWTDPQMLEASPAAAIDRFGRALDIEGDTLVVAASGRTNSGSVHVFHWTGSAWTFRQRIVPDDNANNDLFGFSVALDGELLVVGAPGKSTSGPQSGTAYVFERAASLWEEKLQLRPDDPRVRQAFGTSVDAHLGRVVVGAPGAQVSLETRGTAYVYEPNSGATPADPISVLAPATEAVNQFFGSAVAVYGNDIAVGAPASLLAAGRPPGTVSLYRIGSGGLVSLRNTLVSPDTGEADRFGFSVDMSGRRLVIGQPSVEVPRAWLVNIAALSPDLPSPSAKETEETNRYLALRANKRATTEGKAGWRIGRELRSPFRAEVTVGVFDEQRRAGLESGKMRLELEQAGSEDVHCLELVITGDDLCFQAATGDGPLGDPFVLTGADRADVAVEHDGTTLRFLAREAGTGEFGEIAAIPLPNLTGALVPVVRVEGVGPGAEFGIDDPVIVFNAPLSGDATRAEQLREFVVVAIEHQLAASGMLEVLGEDPDGDAHARLREAKQLLVSALALADDLIADPDAAAKKRKLGPKPARKQLKRAAKRLGKALRKLAKGKPVQSVITQVARVVKSERRALERLGAD